MLSFKYLQAPPQNTKATPQPAGALVSDTSLSNIGAANASSSAALKTALPHAPFSRASSKYPRKSLSLWGNTGGRGLSAAGVQVSQRARAVFVGGVHRGQGARTGMEIGPKINRLRLGWMMILLRRSTPLTIKRTSWWLVVSICLTCVLRFSDS